MLCLFLGVLQRPDKSPAPFGADAVFAAVSDGFDLSAVIIEMCCIASLKPRGTWLTENAILQSK